MLTKSQANSIIGGLTRTTKMPCYSYSIPAQYCRKGSRYRLDPCSVCHVCYAFERGNYTWPTVKNAQQRRYGILLNILTSEVNSLQEEMFIDAFKVLLKKERWFRWHDSGDVINGRHLDLIFKICEETPYVSHRLPTKEDDTLVNILSLGRSVPKNVNIQTSSPFLNEKMERIRTFQIATAYSGCNDAYESGDFTCPATIPHGDSTCGDCRKCWDNLVDIAYIQH